MAEVVQKVRSAIVSVLEKFPSQLDTSSARSGLMDQRWHELPRSSDIPENKHTFEKFCTNAVAHLNAVIHSVTKKYRLNSSKRESLWAEHHRLRCDKAGKLNTWKELLCHLKIADNDPLLKQSVYNELFMVLTKEYFTSQSTNSDPPLQTVELTSDEANALRYAGGYVARTILRKYEKKVVKYHHSMYNV